MLGLGCRGISSSLVFVCLKQAGQYQSRSGETRERGRLFLASTRLPCLSPTGSHRRRDWEALASGYSESRRRSYREVSRFLLTGGVEVGSQECNGHSRPGRSAQNLTNFRCQDISCAGCVLYRALEDLAVAEGDLFFGSPNIGWPGFRSCRAFALTVNGSGAREDFAYGLPEPQLGTALGPAVWTNRPGI